MKKAIEQARAYGLLGEDIFGTGFDFDLHIHAGAGAYICGEETALIESIEGNRGEPPPPPPPPPPPRPTRPMPASGRNRPWSTTLRLWRIFPPSFATARPGTKPSVPPPAPAPRSIRSWAM
jgi:hypothetical protein